MNKNMSLPRDAISDSGALLELSNVLNASVDLDFILGNVLLTAMGKLMISKGVVLVESTEWEFQIRSLKGIHSAQFMTTIKLAVDWKQFLPIHTLAGDATTDVHTLYECCLACGVEALIPMVLNERMVGLVGLGGKISNEPYSTAEITFLESLAAIAATAVKNAMVIDQLTNANRKLDTKLQEMNTLFELSREMNTTFDEENILRILSYALMGQLRVARYAVFTYSSKSMKPVLVKLGVFKEKKRFQEQMNALSEIVHFSEMRKPKTGIEKWLSSQGVSLVIPMLSQNQTRGILCIGARLGGTTYENHDIEYLSALANITISALENARLLKETIEKQRLEKELDLARTIQKGLLPRAIPEFANYEIAATNESSQHVGGDYYDVIQVSPEEVVIAIGDVSGKGIPAALLMANVQAALRTIAPLRLPLAEATERINSIVHSNTSADKFITFFWGILHLRNHTFTYVNAGHNPPYHICGSEVRPLSTGGMILGILPTPPPYESAIIHLKKDDVIATYTDGVNEAMSKDMREYGDIRLIKLLGKMSDSSATSILECIRKDIVGFTRGAKQSDDITMLIVKRLQ